MSTSSAQDDPFATKPEMPPAAAEESGQPAVTPCSSPPVTPSAQRRIRCPYCNNPIQLTDDRFDEVLCPVCCSHFRVQDAQVTTTSGMRQLGKFQLLERV